MRPIIISPTIQEFDGLRFYLCGFYFQRQGKRLHRKVWEFHNGSIPDGAHIHHKDGDRSNNDPDNLECLSIVEHLGEVHGEESGNRARHSLPKARDAAAKWHGSSIGRDWHIRHFDEHIRPKMEQRVPALCQECGAEYRVSAAKVKQGKYCGPNCRAKALRKRRKRAKERRLLP